MPMTETITWKPIETAPKDGRLVLLCGGRWQDDQKDEKAPGIAYFEDGWKLTVNQGGYDFGSYESPTHWAELPVGPTN